jgi:hypothetical protein
LTPDRALDGIERNEFGGFVASMNQDRHRQAFADNKGEGEPPVVFPDRIDNTIRIDVERLTPAQQRRLQLILANRRSGGGSGGGGTVDALGQTQPQEAFAKTQPQEPPRPQPQRPPKPPDAGKVNFAREAGYYTDRIFRDWMDHDVPAEGWKIHVSADAASASAVVDIVLPRLRDMKVNHKVVGDLEGLKQMTGTQAGKFITIYPDSPAHAKAIADAIDGALAGRGLAGPRVEGEKTIGTSGLVYTRYGGFTKDTVTAPDGREVPDRRGQVRPPWVEDPWGDTPP